MFRIAITINVDIISIAIGFVILSFFFKQLKKKGDTTNTFPKLDSLFKIVLVIGNHNNVGVDKKTNIKH